MARVPWHLAALAPCHSGSSLLTGSGVPMGPCHCVCSGVCPRPVGKNPVLHVGLFVRCGVCTCEGPASLRPVSLPATLPGGRLLSIAAAWLVHSAGWVAVEFTAGGGFRAGALTDIEVLPGPATLYVALGLSLPEQGYVF